MTAPRLYLFDDRTARRWAPFTLTRPAGELLFGCMPLRERTERAFGLTCDGHVSRSALIGFDEPNAAPGIALDDVPGDTYRILLSSRAALDLGSVSVPEGPARLVVGGLHVGWVLTPDDATPSAAALDDPSASTTGGPVVEVPGRVLARPWDLVAGSPERISRDVTALWPDEADPPGIVRIGDGLISLGDGATIEPGTVVDTREGPVRLAEGARVEGPARLVGPLFIGAESVVLGGVVGASSIGEVCKIRGEVWDSIFLGFVNKAHDGHIGHAMLGRWVNLGAGTTNSDLKNNYGSVRVWTPDGEIDTGLMKVGCFLGDHAKTGIATVLNTGTVVGAGSNLFGGVMPPTVVPPFSWGAGHDLRGYRLDKFLETAEKALARRNQGLTPGVRRILETAWTATAGRRA